MLYPLHASLHFTGLAAAVGPLVPLGLHGLLKVVEYWTFSLFYCAGGSSGGGGGPLLLRGCAWVGLVAGGLLHQASQPSALLGPGAGKRGGRWRRLRPMAAALSLQ